MSNILNSLFLIFDCVGHLKIFSQYSPNYFGIIFGFKPYVYKHQIENNNCFMTIYSFTDYFNVQYLSAYRYVTDSWYTRTISTKFSLVSITNRKFSYDVSTYFGHFISRYWLFFHKMPAIEPYTKRLQIKRVFKEAILAKAGK